MLCIKIKGVRVCAAFSFFFVIGLMGLADGASALRLFTALGSCLCHESGHILAMSLFGSAPEEMTFYGGGIKIVQRKGKALGRFAETVILLSGCAVNLLLAALAFLTGTGLILKTNLALCVFNLLPFSYFDGGRLMALWLGERICMAVRAVFVLLLAALVIWLLLTGGLSPSLGAAAAMIFLNELVPISERSDVRG